MLGKGSDTTAAKSASGESALNGGSRVKSSYKIEPKDQISVRVSTDLGRRICSGDLYAGEPSSECVAVRLGAGSSALSSTLMALLMPKSSTLTSELPSGRCVRNKFAGFRSRWMRLSECASAT